MDLEDLLDHFTDNKYKKRKKPEEEESNMIIIRLRQDVKNKLKSKLGDLMKNKLEE